MNNVNPETVLVTGGSGYVGSWVAAKLLQGGHRVRATLRDLGREQEVRDAVGRLGSAGDRLEFVRADLLADDGWDRAVEGCAYVMHVASPMMVRDNVRPAREGVMRVLKASARAGVRRVVVTSSSAAASRPPGDARPADETVWTDPDAKGLNDYGRSKTLAERDAWDFMATPARGEMTLTTILPVFIQGPVLGADYSRSVGLVADMLQGKMPAVPRLGFSMVDIRDLADLHVQAMTAPQVAGERIIASSDFLWFADMARILKETLGPAAAKVSLRQAPDIVLRLAGLFNPEIRALAPGLGRRRESSSAKAERLLGWRARPAAQSVTDAGRSLIEAGLA